jgi:hypothetical protein
MGLHVQLCTIHSLFLQDAICTHDETSPQNLLDNMIQFPGMLVKYSRMSICIVITHNDGSPYSRVLQWVPIPMGTQYPPIPMGKWVGNGYGLGRMGG